MTDPSRFLLPEPFPADMNLISVEVFRGEEAVAFGVGIGTDWQRPTIGYGASIQAACEAALREATGRKRFSKADREAFVAPLVAAARTVLRMSVAS